MTDVTRDIFKALAHYEWSDPIKRRTLDKPIPGMGEETIPVEFSKKSKKGKFDSYNLDIDIYSRQDDSPTIQLQKLMTYVERLVVPLSPLIEKAGGNIDAQAILKQAAKLASMPNAAELVIFMDQPAEAAGQASQPAGKPANTTRTYDRVSSAGQTPGGASANMQQLLMGGNPGGASEGAPPAQ
jgi:hypothetical protein